MNSTQLSAKRKVARSALSIIFVISLFLTLFSGWARVSVFDRNNFSSQAVNSLKSESVRNYLAAQITDQLVANGPSQLASFQTVLRAAWEQLLDTPIARKLFKTAVDDVHDYLFTQDGNAALVNLTQAVAVLTGSLQLSNPELASSLPDGSTEVFVKVGDTVRNAELWRAADQITELTAFFAAGVIVAAFALWYLEKDRRKVATRLGFGIFLGGTLTMLAAVLLPLLAHSYANNSDARNAIESTVSIFLSSLRATAFWAMLLGVVVVAFANASAPEAEERSLAEMLRGFQDRIDRFAGSGDQRRAINAILLIAAGGATMIWAQQLVPLLMSALGAFIIYVGSYRLLCVVGRKGDAPLRQRLKDDVTNPQKIQRHTVRIAVIGTLLLVFVGFASWYSIFRTHDRAVAAPKQTCNGYAELCNRPFNEVAFAGTHNSMSAQSDRGWLFAEQPHGIPAQLEFGVRAFLMKTHYGIPTEVNVTGAKLVVTDRAAELAVNPKAVDNQLPPEQRAQAEQLSRNVNVDPSLRDIYLCHVYCEYGALRLHTAMTYYRQFLSLNPDNVIVLFIGDYVSNADTEKVLRDTKTFDMVWNYDPTATSFPTLGEMIANGKRIVWVSEFTGQPPTWNTPGYGIYQDTPFTFTEANQLFTPGSPLYKGDQTVDGPIVDVKVSTNPSSSTGLAATFGPVWTGLPSCAPNRGTPTSPLFEVNHFVTPAGSAPTAATAKVVNSFDVLWPRVANCATQRNKFPNLVAVNFYNQGDLLAVVNKLNGTDDSQYSSPVAMNLEKSN